MQTRRVWLGRDAAWEREATIQLPVVRCQLRRSPCVAGVAEAQGFDSNRFVLRILSGPPVPGVERRSYGTRIAVKSAQLGFVHSCGHWSRGASLDECDGRGLDPRGPDRKRTPRRGSAKRFADRKQGPRRGCAKRVLGTAAWGRPRAVGREVWGSRARVGAHGGRVGDGGVGGKGEMAPARQGKPCTLSLRRWATAGDWAFGGSMGHATLRPCMVNRRPGGGLLSSAFLTACGLAVLTLRLRALVQWWCRLLLKVLLG